MRKIVITDKCPLTTKFNSPKSLNFNNIKKLIKERTDNTINLTAKTRNPGILLIL